MARAFPQIYRRETNEKGNFKRVRWFNGVPCVYSQGEWIPEVTAVFITNLNCYSDISQGYNDLNICENCNNYIYTFHKQYDETSTLCIKCAKRLIKAKKEERNKAYEHFKNGLLSFEELSIKDSETDEYIEELKGKFFDRW